MTICQPQSAFRLLPMAICLNKPEKSPYSLAIVSLIIMLLTWKMYVIIMKNGDNIRLYRSEARRDLADLS